MDECISKNALLQALEEFATDSVRKCDVVQVILQQPAVKRELSHVMMIEVVREVGPYKTDEVILFNANHISAEEALRHVRAAMYSPDVLVLPKKQLISLFRDGKAD